MGKEKPAMPWDLIDPRIKPVPESVYQNRYEICLSCPLLNQKMKTCGLCGCFMKLKATLPNAYCPENKWEAYEQN
jgi:hypothetical protein